jgi:hypothetical protein
MTEQDIAFLMLISELGWRGAVLMWCKFPNQLQEI